MFWKIHQFISDKMKIIGAVCLVGMALLTACDVIGRLFKHPIFGSVEIVTYLAVFVVAMALPFTQEQKGHISVELFVHKLPKKTRAVIDLSTGIAGLILFMLVAWRMFIYASNMKASGEVSMNLQFPEYIIIFVVSGACVMFCLSIVKTLLNSLAELIGK
ncbi:MAG: TRAP transporter small permease [Desulfobacteraceae bacterium]|jgi:TRAP-type C4-dicarboxylate transport system permease small subunit